MPRMPRVSTQGPSGVAKLLEGKQQGKPVVQVTFDESGDVIYINKTKDTCPSYVQNGIFWVKLSSDTRKIESMRPVSGNMKGKVAKFVAKEGESPVPRTRTGMYGNYEVFGVIFEITKPEKYAGMQVYCEFSFDFVPARVKVKTADGEEMHDVLAIPISKSKRVEMLDNFVMATKAMKQSYIPYSDNPLPTLEKRILREQAEFEFTLKDGWVNSILPPDLNDDFAAPVPADESTVDFGTPDEAEEFSANDEFETTSETFETSEDTADFSTPPWDEVED